MTEALKFDLTTIESIPDPTTESGQIFLFDEALGQNGRPFVFAVEDPPNKTRPRHYHRGDVLYVYTKGEHHIEGEGTYRAGDLRWTRSGHVYGPETTGPQGGTWWVISYSDPIPVNVDSEADDSSPLNRSTPPSSSGREEIMGAPSDSLPRFERPYDWSEIDRAVQGVGGAILTGLLSSQDVSALNSQVDECLADHAEAAKPASGSDIYNLFLGHKTLRLHGIMDKIPLSIDLIGRPEIVEWAERMIGPNASSVLLNAGELIQIQPGEPAQFLHRDSDSWPAPITANPLVVNSIVALDACTLDNGATYIAPGSWQWAAHRQPKASEFARATMEAGDAVLFRGDVIHGGGENETEARRRVLSISYCAGWLRPVENSFLNLPRDLVGTFSSKQKALVGYAAHDATRERGGMIGLYENGDPARVLETKGNAAALATVRESETS